MLVRLTYASRTAEPIGNELIDRILAKSRVNNPELGITGVLCYGERVFVQALEGGRAQVNALYNRIVQDKSHTDVTLLDYSEIESRQYASWNMAKVRLDKVNLSVLLKYSERPVLDPFSVTGPAMSALLAELAATAAFTCRGE